MKKSILCTAAVLSLFCNTLPAGAGSSKPTDPEAIEMRVLTPSQGTGGSIGADAQSSLLDAPAQEDLERYQKRGKQWTTCCKAFTATTTLLGVCALAGIGYAIYGGVTGDWTFQNLFSGNTNETFSTTETFGSTGPFASVGDNDTLGDDDDYSDEGSGFVEES